MADSRRNEDVVRQFCALMEKRDAEALRPFFTADAVYQNVGMPASTGIDAIVENMAAQFSMFPESYAFEIVNLASTFSFIATPGFAAYSVAKAGVAHMTKVLAIEWADHGIRVNAIAPGSTETATRKEALNDPARREFFLNRIPLKRFGRPSEVADMCVYLLSDESAFVTGAEFAIDGGLTAK